MIGLDTDAIIEFFRKDPALISLMRSLDEELTSTIINYQEIMFGLDPQNKKHLEEKDFFDSFFNDLIFLDLNKNSGDKASEIFWDLGKKGIVSGKFDCMIAGILLSNGVNKIITRNVKHFEKIPGLKIISY
jgi:tRNA(fMet)-specific endonuclease VapC